MSGYESVNRNVFESSVEGCQRWHRRNLRWQALGASNWKCSAANSGAVNRRLDEAVAAMLGLGMRCFVLQLFSHMYSINSDEFGLTIDLL